MRLQEFVQHWLTSYDWRKWEARLNSFAQFTQPIQGIELHYVHERSAQPDAVPLLLLHGWPGSYFEFYKLIPLLKATGRFHIVVPSLPGARQQQQCLAPTAAAPAAETATVAGANSSGWRQQQQE